MKLEIPIVSYFTIGVYWDFNQYWFVDVGYQIATVLLIKAFFPPTEFISKFSLWFFLRSLDQRRCCRKLPPEKTSQKTLFGYMKLYSGREFEIYKEYSLLIMFTWVTFLFAPGLPILFPIGLLYMIVLYTTDRLTLAYWHRRPPVYDENMNETTIRLLSTAPLLYACMAAWLYGNQ